jgi:hypothetical protein
MSGYCALLKEYSNNRPAKKESLLNSIKAKFKNEPVEPEKILEELVKKKVVLMVDNKVSYNEKC